MHRGTRQKLDGDGRDWVSMRTRRLFGLTRRPRIGRSTKRRLARRRRRQLIDIDDV
jgi:hypothetical protein